MRTLKTSILIALTLFIMPYLTKAQEDKTQSYWVHEDVVKPAMLAEYETTCKELTSNMKKHNIQELNVIVTQTTDNRYLWVSPISAFADIDRPVFKTLSEKMGADNMNALFDRMNKAYDIEHDYVIRMDKELSYMPEGITQTPEGQDYRKFHYFHYTPANANEVKKKALAIRNLFESKGSKVHYRTYHSGFGTRGAFYMVAIAAKDAADYANKIAENNTLLGEEWQKTYGDFIGTLIKYEPIEGQMRPDMGYSPSN